MMATSTSCRDIMWISRDIHACMNSTNTCVDRRLALNYCSIWLTLTSASRSCSWSLGSISRIAGTCPTWTLNLLAFMDALLETLIVHVEISHRFFFGSTWHTAKDCHKWLIIWFELVLDLFLFCVKFLQWQPRQMFPLYLSLIKMQLLKCFNQFDFRFILQPII